MSDSSLCPCNSGLLYKECCQPLHQHTHVAEDAEKLMRSRYSAYHLGLVDYLLETLHPSKRHPGEREALQESISQTEWLGLKIIDHKEANNLAEVEFVAFYDDEPLGQLRERSRFTREAGRWFYHDGLFLPPLKLGRNEVCFCGSGRKFKQCHGS
jgi:SEC-C motif-containing protein